MPKYFAKLSETAYRVPSVETLIVTALAGAAENGGFDPWSLLGPAVTAAIVAGLVSLAQVVATGKREIKRQLLEFRLRQINELYAPILFLLAEDKALSKTLREMQPNPDGWHLLDNLITVRGNAHSLEMAKRIVEINQAIKDVLTKNAGLTLRADLPGSYHDFIAHADLVARGVETGTVASGVQPKYFPQAFEVDIKESYSALITKVSKDVGVP